MGKYSFEALLQFCKENDLTLAKNYSAENFHSDLVIECHCLQDGCDKTGTKQLYKLVKDKFVYCKPCSYKLRQIKKEETCMKTLGCKNPMQNKDIKIKAENTNLKKYGHKHASQSDQIKENMSESVRL
jgi:hypothetical protein